MLEVLEYIRNITHMQETNFGSNCNERSSFATRHKEIETTPVGDEHMMTMR